MAINLSDFLNPVTLASHKVTEAQRAVDTATLDFQEELRAVRERINTTIGKGETTGNFLHDCLLLAFNPLRELFEAVSRENELLSNSADQFFLLGFKHREEHAESSAPAHSADENAYTKPHHFILGRLSGKKITAERSDAQLCVPIQHNWDTIFPFSERVEWVFRPSMAKLSGPLRMPTATESGANATDFFQHLVPKNSIIPPPPIQEVSLLGMASTAKYREPAGLISIGPIGSLDEIIAALGQNTGMNAHAADIERAFTLLNTPSAIPLPGDAEGE